MADNSPIPRNLRQESLHRFDHAPLHCGHAVAGVTGRLQVCIHQHRVTRLKTEVAVQRAHQSTHGDHRRRDQNGADGNLENKQHVSDGDSPPQPRCGSRFDDLIWIGPENLAHRNNAEENPLTNAKTKATK